MNGFFNPVSTIKKLNLCGHVDTGKEIKSMKQRQNAECFYDDHNYSI